VFHEPVDPKKFGISDYFEIVKNPMDFSTIKKKLTHNVYSEAREFVDDMMLVFSNCMLYNGNESDIGKLGIEMRKLFEDTSRAHGLLQE
jgi:bromodomain-containing factor 1